MKRRTFIRAGGLAATSMALPLTPAMNLHGSVMPSSRLQTVNPVDNRKALVNPDMGWTMHYYSNVITNYGSRLEPSDTLDYFPGLSTVYLRVPWAFLELEEGKFNWELLDTPAQRWIEKGKKVAFRISAEESWMRYATPEWVVKAGAKGHNVKWGGGEIWEPVFDDPVFIEKVDKFLETFAKRYENNPNVAFVDVGHFGLWGEGHTVLTTGIDYSFEVKKLHIDLYLKHFRNTLLCISDDFAGHNRTGDFFPITDYALSRGVTIRDDSIMVHKYPQHWYHAEMAQQFWPKFPVILEHQHYGASLRDGAWSKELFLKSVEDYHASYMSIHWWPDVLYEENRDVIEKINLRMGYRLQLDTLSWPGEAVIGEPFSVKAKWGNAGVAPCYPGGFPCYTLKDDKGGIVTALVDEQFDFRYLQVGGPGSPPWQEFESAFTIGPAFKDPFKTFARVVQAGRFDLFVSVGLRDGTPVFELPYDGNDGFRRYKVGSMVLKDIRS